MSTIVGYLDCHCTARGVTARAEGLDALPDHHGQGIAPADCCRCEISRMAAEGVCPPTTPPPLQNNVSFALSLPPEFLHVYPDVLGLEENSIKDAANDAKENSSVRVTPELNGGMSKGYDDVYGA